MHISDLVNQYNNNLASGSEISVGTKGVEQLTRTLQNLQPGQIFEGTINAVKGNKVVLGLSSGQNITATLDASMSLTKGQSVFFQVKSNSDGLIQIKPVTNGAMNNPTILTALDAANLTVNERNVNMVNNMMKQSMAIDSQSLNNMSKVIANNPDVNVSTIVEMTKLDMPVSHDMAVQFENYKDNEAQLMKTMTHVTDEIPNLLADESMDVADAVKLNRDIVSIISNENVSTNDAANITSNSAVNNLDSSLSNTTQSSSQPTTQAFDISGQVVVPELDADGNLTQNIYDASGRPLMPQLDANGNPMFDATGNMMLVVDDSKPGLTPGMLANFNNIPTYDTESFPVNSIGNTVESNDLNVLNNILKTETIFLTQHPEYTDAKGNLDPNVDVKNLMKDLSAHLNQELPSRDVASRLFSAKAYKSLVGNLTQQQWMINPEDVSKENAIKDLYKKLEDNMQRLQEAVAKFDRGDSPVNKSISDIRSNIEFMNQVNQQISYVQIPLRMSGQNANADLYVFNNKKSNYEEGDKITAFLHFDMDHLGSTDIAVTMENKKVDTKFFLEDDASYDLIMNNIHILQAKIEAKGYDCNIDIENESKSVNLVEDFLKKDTSSSKANLSRYSFDVRA